jgi:CubicO group peptidase (beta-lactamase class C family)
LLVAASPAAEETPSQKAAALLDGLIDTNSPGLAVLVAQDGKILFEKGYGLADRQHNVPIIPQTTFCIASVTKQFTAAAILKLQEQGKLNTRDKLSKHIPDYPRGNEVTLRHLLTHTSGIHNYNDDPAFIERVTNRTTDAIVEAMKKQPYDFDPGTKWRYANSDYMLLGCIVEKVSGQSYEDFLRENFFQQLGMTNTSVYVFHERPALPNEAVGYGLGTNGFEPAPDLDWSWFGGAGALCSTVEDLYLWNEGLFNGRVLNAASLKTAFTPVHTRKHQINSDTGYGFGWGVSRYRGLRMIWHPGGGPGFSSMLARVPNEKFTVAILANAMPGSTNANPNVLACQLMNIFLADKLVPLPTVNTNISPKSYDALIGRYDFIPPQAWGPYWGYILTIARRDGHLFSQIGNDPEQELFPRSQTEFFWKEGGDAGITFVKGTRGKAVRLIFHQSGIATTAPRVKDITEAKVDPAVYDSLAGKYDYCYGTALTIMRDGDHFFAQLDGQPKYEFFPKSETEYFSKAVDAQITFVKNPAGKVTRAIVHQGDEAIVVAKLQ